MKKEDLLQEITNSIASGEISKEEIFQRLQFASTSAKTEGILASKKITVNKILYVLGAAIVLVGLVIFVQRIWDQIGSIGRVLVTLGMGAVFTASGVALSKSRPNENIGSLFLAIGGILIPGGSMVLLHEIIGDSITNWNITFVFGVIFVFYLALAFSLKNVVLTLFTIANGTAFVYWFVFAILDKSYYQNGDIIAYLTMIIGLSYLLMGNSFKNTWNSRLTASLYFLGSFGFLGACFSQIFDNNFWLLIFPLLVIGGLFISVMVRGKGILIVSTLYLVAYVSYITGKYFAGSLGWPLSLIALGLIFIGLGYMSININKKYLS